MKVLASREKIELVIHSISTLCPRNHRDCILYVFSVCKLVRLMFLGLSDSQVPTRFDR